MSENGDGREDDFAEVDDDFDFMWQNKKCPYCKQNYFKFGMLGHEVPIYTLDQLHTWSIF